MYKQCFGSIDVMIRRVNLSGFIVIFSIHQWIPHSFHLSVPRFQNFFTVERPGLYLMGRTHSFRQIVLKNSAHDLVFNAKDDFPTIYRG
jgi:hypothetical protein